MANLGSFLFLKHLRAEPNQHVLHFSNGNLTREGPGLSYWFNPLTAAVAQVPVEDCETTFVLKERSADLQDISVQTTIRYRVVDPRRASDRINFTISLENGDWLDEPFERLSDLLEQRAQATVRKYAASVPVVECITAGAEVMRQALDSALRTDEELEAMGLAVIHVQVARVAPSSELEKALQTPAREGLQQKADEATFQRRALAVENERAIKENEITSEIELTRRQEQLIERQAANELLAANKEAEAERARIESKLERRELAAATYARTTQQRAEGDADAIRAPALATADGEARRVEVWKAATGKVLAGLALQELAGKIDHIQHLNISPSLLGDALQTFLTNEAER